MQQIPCFEVVTAETCTWTSWCYNVKLV